tara:strand:- start:2622 stop:3374 length:753 start_codon:yes stop_codon:yes gene_type:complete
MIHKFKLKHLNDIAKKNIDYKVLMSELFEYRDNWFNRILHLIKSHRKMLTMITIINSLQLKKIEPDPDCKILLPDSVDNITFIAMMKVQILMTDPGDRTTAEAICELIATVCYSANLTNLMDPKFDTDSLDYKKFKLLVWNTSAVQMFGLYNSITKSLDESSKIWQERFLSVQVEDKDYEAAGGNRMNQFNVITTIERLCSAFNYTEEEAWQVSYSLSQTHSYKNSTYGHIQNEMTLIKERKMKQQRSVR